MGRRGGEVSEHWLHGKQVRNKKNCSFLLHAAMAENLSVHAVATV